VSRAQTSLVQLQNDPICNSSGCTQYLHPDAKDQHPINYGVPDFGVDHDIKVSIANTEVAEEKKPDFNPKPIGPEAYENEFEIEPEWERKPGPAQKWYSKD